MEKKTAFHVKSLLAYNFTWNVKLYFSEKIRFKISCELFVLRFYAAVNPLGSCQVWSVYLITLFLDELSPLSGKPEFVHIHVPETDNCPSWISRRERMTIENISWSISMKECCQTRLGSNSWPDHQSDIYVTEPLFTWNVKCYLKKSKCHLLQLW